MIDPRSRHIKVFCATFSTLLVCSLFARVCLCVCYCWQMNFAARQVLWKCKQRNYGVSHMRLKFARKTETTLRCWNSSNPNISCACWSLRLRPKSILIRSHLSLCALTSGFVLRLNRVVLLYIYCPFQMHTEYTIKTLQ